MMTLDPNEVAQSLRKSLSVWRRNEVYGAKRGKRRVFLRRDLGCRCAADFDRSWCDLLLPRVLSFSLADLNGSLKMDHRL